MTQEQILEDYAKLRSVLDVRDAKYRRNYNRYANAGVRRDDIRSFYGQPFGMWQRASEDDTSPVPINQLIKSAIDTHVSKMSQTKVRPFFTPVNGEYKTRKACRAAQQYFDELYEVQDMAGKAILALRDAEIFDTGALWVDEQQAAICRLAPWEVYFDAAEIHYGKLTRIVIRRDFYPIMYLKDLVKKGSQADAKLLQYRGAKCSNVVYYDLAGKQRHDLIDGEVVKTSKLESDTCPIAFVYYTQPIAGNRATSLCDDLLPIQLTMDMLSQRIKDAAELTPANTIFVPSAAGFSGSMVSNRIGNVYTYSQGPQGGLPVVSTPRPIDPMFLQLLQYWEGVGFNTAGISQLSAQAKKPSGLNSGVALQTLEDVESERHNVILQCYIRLWMDVAKIMLEVMPESADILPKTKGRAKVSWKDIKRERELFSIQFSATSSLSKDPKTKMEQIEKLIQMGLVDKDYITSLLEMPDLEDCYSIGTAAHDAAQNIIDRAIEEEEYTYNEVVGTDLLYRECVLTILRLDAANESQEVIGRVVGLMRAVKNTMDAVAVELAPPPAPAPVPQVAPPPLPAATI